MQRDLDLELELATTPCTLKQGMHILCVGLALSESSVERFLGQLPDVWCINFGLSPDPQIHILTIFDRIHLKGMFYLAYVVFCFVLNLDVFYVFFNTTKQFCDIRGYHTI